MGPLLAQDQPGPGRPRRQVDQVGGLGDPSAVADTTVGVDRRIPALTDVEGVHGVLHPPIHGVAEGEPHPRGAAGVGEVVGGPGGVAAHQHRRLIGVVAMIGVGPPSRRQAGECLRQDTDVVSCGVGAGATWAQQPGQRFTAGDLRAIQKRQQRVMPEGLLPGRPRLLLVIGMIDNQGGVDIDV